MVKPKLHVDGYEIHTNAQRIPHQLFLKLKKTAKKAGIIFNNTRKLRGNDKKRGQAYLIPGSSQNDSTAKFMRELFKYSLQKFPNLLPNTFVVLKSKEGCQPQLPHCDYVQNKTFNPETDEQVPLGCIVAVQNGTKFDVWPKSHQQVEKHRKKIVPDSVVIKRETLNLNKGDLLFFRGDLVHAGSSYETTNHRVHFFLDNPKIKRPANATWFANFKWIN